MLIFGFGYRTIKNYGSIKQSFCSSCQMVSEIELIKVTVWFSLFFIPVFPYNRRYLLLCKKCKSIEELDKSSFEEYLNKVQDDNTDGVASRENEDEKEVIYLNKTETQINYLKEIEAYRREVEEREKLGEQQ